MIPRIIHQVWIGNRPAPEAWMRTWREKHPDWEYRRWGNREVRTRKWINQKHVDTYWLRGVWHGVADLIRYEILHEFGGFMPSTDSECLLPVDDLFNEPMAYSVYENERAAPGLISPLMACEPGNPFALDLIRGLKAKERLGVPWKTTGNRYMQEMFGKTKHPHHIYPSHYLNPTHWTGVVYEGPGPVYASQKWGTTNFLRGKK